MFVTVKRSSLLHQSVDDTHLKGLEDSPEPSDIWVGFDQPYYLASI